MASVEKPDVVAVHMTRDELDLIIESLRSYWGLCPVSMEERVDRLRNDLEEM